jgi:hypothetical protein
MLLGGALAGCATPISQPPDRTTPSPSLMATAVEVVPARAETPIDPFPVPAGEPRQKRVLSKRFQLSIPLPDRPGWALIRDKSSFLVMRHVATESELVARLWRESENMTRQRCEANVRLIRDVPEVERQIDERVIEVPLDFDTEVKVGLSIAEPGAPIGGQLLAFGASARWCFAFVYQTTARGPGAERVVGDRLAVIEGLTLDGIERRLGTQLGAGPDAR